MTAPKPPTKAARTKTRLEFSPWELLPPEVLSKLDSTMVETIIKSVDREARIVQNQTWAGLVLGFLTIPLLVIVAWHYADTGAPHYGAIIVTSGGASIVGLFLGVRRAGARRFGR